jgi:hypothetical protein
VRRALIASVAVNAVLTVVLLAWVSWIVLEPRFWFESAYAEKGPTGDRGPRGIAGPAGPPGPVGPDAEDAIFGLESALGDLDSRITDLEDATSASELQSQVENVAAALEELCSAISQNYFGGSNSATEQLLFDLYLACP